MKVLFLTEGRDVPASRFRAEQFFPALTRRGVACRLIGGYGPAYNRVLGTRLAAPYSLATRTKRAVLTVLGVRYDAVFLQRTAIPHTALPEQLLARVHPRLVFDFDDALWLGPGGVRSRSRSLAFDRAVAVASWVIAGNQFLGARAGVPLKTSILPTVVDTDRYVPDATKREAGPVVGWMGTSGNMPFLARILPELMTAIENVPGARLRVVSNVGLPGAAGHRQVEQIPWTREREVALLQSFDVGLMPLANDDVTRGKCGFKMIQYMAVGAAVVASGVGANVELFEGSGAGELVAPGASFGPAVARLLADRAAREEAGQRGRAHAEAHFGLEPTADRLVEIFERVASGS